MSDIVMGCAEVNVVHIAIPRFTVTKPSSTVTVRNPNTSLIVKNPSLKVTVQQPTSQTHIFVPIAGPPGPAGTGSISLLADQDPLEGPDGIITTFTAPYTFNPASLAVFLNGLHEHHIINKTGSTFEFTTPPEPGDTIKLTFSTT